MNTLKLRPLYTLLWMLLAIAGTACDTTVKTDEAEVGAAVGFLATANPDQVFKIDTSESTVTWIAAKVTGRHNGFIPVREGNVTFHNGGPRGGKAVFEMARVRSDDKSIDVAGNTKLSNQLRSPDFFNVDQFPVSTFVITTIAPLDSTNHQEPHDPEGLGRHKRIQNPNYKVTGNLTIKDITRSISFPARIELQDSVLRAKANFNIDRTYWNITYRSDKSLGNRTIYPAVNIGLDIVAYPQ